MLVRYCLRVGANAGKRSTTNPIGGSNMDTKHTEQVITEELIARAVAMGACWEGILAAGCYVGQPIGVLMKRYANWAARLFDGRSILTDGTQEWWLGGERHREDGPAVIWADGRTDWYLNGLRHRKDGPAVVYPDGGMLWYRNGVAHRDDGPAVNTPDGMQEWWVGGLRHREDGPAVIHANGSKEWWLNGQRHRTDGPAVVLADGTEEWWCEGKRALQPV
jgi:hypothetical protein